MSHDHEEPSYSQLYINAWTTLSALVAAAIFIGLCLNGPLTHAGQWIWDLLRYLARPII
jgi:hypothetical protein